MEERDRFPWYATGVVLIGASLVLRVLAFPFVTSDYAGFLSHWFLALATNGWSVFTSPFADYAPLYLYLLKLLGYLPIPSLVSIKALSCIFDAVLAWYIYRIVKDAFRAGPGLPFLAGAVAFSLPTVLVNSALWGQSDSLYAAMVVACLYYLLVRRPLAAAIAFGVAVSFKLQAVFFAPVFIGYLLARWRTLPYLFVVPAVFLLSIVPAVLAGGSPTYWGLIYLKQSGEYPWLTLSAPSWYAFVEKLSLSANATPLFYAGLGAALAVSLAIIIYVARRLLAMSMREFMTIALVTVLAAPYLLPRMHERYFFLADILAVILAFAWPQQWFVPIVVVACSLIAYVPYLASQAPSLGSFPVDIRYPAAALLLLLLWLAFSFVALRVSTRRRTAARTQAA